MRLHLGLFVVLATLLSVAGCQKVNLKGKRELTPMEVYVLSVDAPRSAQKVKVTVTPSNGPVGVYLVKAENVAKVQAELEKPASEPNSSLVLGSQPVKKAAEPVTVEGTVPSGSGYSIFIRNGGKSNEITYTVEGK